MLIILAVIDIPQFFNDHNKTFFNMDEMLTGFP